MLSNAYYLDSERFHSATHVNWWEKYDSATFIVGVRAGHIIEREIRHLDVFGTIHRNNVGIGCHLNISEFEILDYAWFIASSVFQESWAHKIRVHDGKSFND